MLHATERINGGDPVGEPAPAVLAVAGAVRHRLDGRESFRAAAHGGLRRGAAAVGVAYTILSARSWSKRGPGLKLAPAVGRDLKGKLSIVLYAAAIPLAFVNQWIADAIYVLVALMWLVPDRRIERGCSTQRRPDPDAQIAVMQADVARLIANGQPLELFGDQLFLELDLLGRESPAGEPAAAWDRQRWK